MAGALIRAPYTSLQHAMRVLKILNVDDLVDGLVFCEYSDPNFSCKPEREYYDGVRFSCVTARSLVLIIA